MVLNGYKVKFIHQNNTNLRLVGEFDKSIKDGTRPPSYTGCEVYELVDGAEPILVGRGKATLHERDNYCKEKGRMISLGRALKDSGFSKTQRREFWEAYRTSSSKPRW